MEKSGTIPIKDRAANKERMAKKRSKPGKSQSKTDSNLDISRIEDDIANFVEQRESTSGESANERTDLPEPVDPEDQTLMAGGSTGGASGRKRKSPTPSKEPSDDGDDSSTGSENSSDSSVSAATARGEIISNSDSSSDSDSDSESKSSSGSEGKSSKATAGNPTRTPLLKIKKRNTS